MVTLRNRTPESQTRHDAEVRRRYRQFVEDARWSDVRADLPDAVKPDVYDGHRPDVSGMYGGRLYLLEVETADSYSSDHAKSQYQAFASAAGLIVDVPVSVKALAESLLKALGIVALVWDY